MALVQIESERRLQEGLCTQAESGNILYAMSHILQSLESSCLSWETLASECQAQSHCWQLKLCEVEMDRDVALNDWKDAHAQCKKHEAGREGMVTLVESLEQSCLTLEVLVTETLMRKDAYEARHMEQMQDAYQAEFLSSKEWNRKMQHVEKVKLELQVEAEVGAAQWEATMSELVLGINQIEFVETLLMKAHLACQKQACTWRIICTPLNCLCICVSLLLCASWSWNLQVAWMGVVRQEWDKLQELGDAWRARAESTAIEKCATEEELLTCEVRLFIFFPVRCGCVFFFPVRCGCLFFFSCEVWLFIFFPCQVRLFIYLFPASEVRFINFFPCEVQLFIFCLISSPRNSIWPL